MSGKSSILRLLTLYSEVLLILLMKTFECVDLCFWNSKFCFVTDATYTFLLTPED